MSALIRIVSFSALACTLLGAAEQRGVIRSAGLPIPGATVTASQGDHKLVTSSDEAGAYVFDDLPPGNWHIQVEMSGFASTERDITVAGGSTPADIELKLRPPAAPVRAQAPAPARATAAAAAFQQLAIAQTAQNDIQAAMSAPPPEMPSEELSQSANESFLLSGSLSRGLQEPQMEEMGIPNREELRQRFEAMRQSGGLGGGPGGDPRGGGSPGGGGPPGGGRGPGGGGPPMMMGGRGGPRGGPGGSHGHDHRPGSSRYGAFGNRSGRGRDTIHGGASFSLHNSALDATPYSVNGQEIPKPSYAQSRFSLMAGGMLHIPKLISDDKSYFFLSYFGTRSRNPYNANATLPTALERAGDFSQSYLQGPVTIYDPLTNQPFAGNRIPASRIDAASNGMLGLIPLPNQPGNVRNYQIVSSVPQNTNNFGLRLSRSFGSRERVSGSFNLQQRDGASTQLYGFRDTSSGRGANLDVTWTHTIAAGFVSNLRASFSRSSNDALPYFAYGTDWASQLGISGTSTDPVNYGPPNLSFTNFCALTDGSPSRSSTQTASLGEGLMRVHGKHTISFGGEYRRFEINTHSDQNARGTYVFSGLRTSGFDSKGNSLLGTGFDFADYLLGMPQSSSIRFGSTDTYFRGARWSANAQDDWRIRSNLTINAGVRYEYLTPLHEKYGRMANLDIAPGFTNVAVVTPDIAGPYSGAFPDGMVNPDRNNIAPRVGIAWKPLPKHSLLIRSGYGWYYNGSVYNQMAARLAQQPPFANSSSINTSLEQPLTVAKGFLAGSSKQINNTYAVDRYYTVGYAQTWNFAVQQELPHSLILEVGYLGTKGTHLDLQRMPNRAASGSPLTSEQRRQIANASGFTFDSSDGNSIYHAGQVRFTRRFRSGVAVNALYTYAKSIDNASTLGGGGAVVAQNDQDLAAERGLSSFDRRHNLSLSYMLSSSSSGAAQPRNFLIRDWQTSGSITIRSGSPFTATVLGNRSDAGGSGAVGSARADATGLPVTLADDFFNPAAFSVPLPGFYGNAARNTIPGPTLFAMNMSVGRTIRFGETRRSMDLRVEASNVLNNVTITRIGTTVNSLNYGLALDAASMRSISLNLRFRF